MNNFLNKVWGFIIAGILLLTFSCKESNSSTNSSSNTSNQLNDSLIRTELAQIDMNEVDSYPLFEQCTSTSTKEEQKKCFENTLGKLFNQILSKSQFVVNETVQDTIIVIGKVDNKGAFIFEKTLCKDKTRDLLPKLDSVLTDQMSKITPIEPALKKGLQVNAQFQMPLVVNVK